MATINYKEKYEKAVRAAMLAKQDTESAVTIRILEEIFPELKESEDERIRKEILEYFQQFENEELRGVNISDWIAWIEKQSEQKVSEYDIVKTIKERIIEHFDNHLIIDKCFSIGGLKDDILKIINEVKFAKQGEQKPAWSEEDDYNLQCCIAKIQYDIDNGRIGRNRELLTWLKSIKDRVQLQPKQEWGEKDEENLNGIMNFICFHSSLVAGGTDEWYDFLKSLKDRVQPQNTWKPSEELLDVFIKNAIDFFESNFNPLTDGGVIGAFDDKEKMIEEFKEYMKEEGLNEEWI